MSAAQADGVPHPTPEQARVRRRTLAKMAAHAAIPEHGKPSLNSICDFADAHARAYHIAKDTPATECVEWERAWRDVSAAKSRLVEEVMAYVEGRTMARKECAL